MADSVVTVRDVFDLPHPDSPGASTVRWQSLREWLNEALADKKALSMDDLGPIIEQLLNIPISDIFVASWKETKAIKDLLAASREAPEAVTNVELADHTIQSKHQPYIEVPQKKAASKKIQFTLRLVFKLQRFSLRIQNGLINEMRTGPCEMQGTLEYQGLAVADKKNAAIQFPAVVVLQDSVPRPKSNHTPTTPAPETSPIEHVLVPPTRHQPLTPPKLTQGATTVEPKKVAATADFSSLVPPKKIIPQVVEPPPAVKESEVPPEAPQQEAEEEREVFVL